MDNEFHSIPFGSSTPKILSHLGFKSECGNFTWVAVDLFRSSRTEVQRSQTQPANAAAQIVRDHVARGQAWNP